MTETPISRLAFARQEIDRVFGENYAREHPDVVAAVMASAASDFAALAITGGLQAIADALLVDEHETEQRMSIVQASGLVRP